MERNIRRAVWAVLILTTALQFQFIAPAYVSWYDMMKCSYGERGSLTAICVNATSGYFKNTPYRFDQLDETLKCINCTLTTLDTSTFDISGNQIKILDLTRSKIEMIKQKAFVGLIFLENLNLTYNSIRSIYPGTFTGVKKIKYIDLSHNQLNILSDDGFLELLNLETLNLGFNSIQTVAPKAFNGLVKLKELNLKDNQISDLKAAVSNLTSLQILNLEYNHIVSLKGTEFTNLTQLLELNLSYNKLQSPVIEFPPQSLLRRLHLQNNLIDKISSNFLKGLHSLEVLDISYNQIADIPQRTLQSLNNLRYLYLAYNRLTTFQTGTFSGLPQLEELNCSHNRIQDIEITGVFPLHSLHSLDFSYNAISDLDYVGLISRVPRLSFLKMEHNSLPCDLEDEMEAYFAEDNFKFFLFDNRLGSLKCIDTPIKRTRQLVPDRLVGEATPEKSGVSGTEITLIVFMCIIFACIGFLFFLQFRTYRDSRYLGPQRTTSSAQLVASNLDNDDYLKE